MSIPIIMRLPEVCKKTGLSRSTIYELQSIGAFPHSVPLSIRTVGWIEQEIDEWLQKRIERRKIIR